MNMKGNMDSHHVTDLHNMDWGEVDTTPIESVKAAVTLFGGSVFGDHIDGKRLKIQAGERERAKKSELHQVQKEFGHLQHAEATKAQAQLDVEEANKVMEDLAYELEKAKKSSPNATEVSELAKLQGEGLEAANTHMKEANNRGLQVELNAARDQHMVATAELEAAKQELRMVKEELAASVEAKALAIKQAEDSRFAAEKHSNRLEELVKEITAANESLVLVKLACEKAEKANAAIIAEKEAEAEIAEQTRKQLEALRKELDAAKDLEFKMSATTATVENLQKELISAKESESKAAKAASDASENLNKLMSEFGERKKSESDAAASLKSVTAELEEAKENLKRVTEEGFVLRDSMDLLKAELDQANKELAKLKESEAEAQVSVAILNSELHQSRSKLAAGAAAEAKARGTTLGLSLALKQLAIEAETAKKVAEAMKEEARKSKLEAEQAKANISTVATLQDEAEGPEKTELCHGITILREEYDSLIRRAEEADELADMKVAAILARAEECEQEVLMKLRVANTKIEELKSAAQQALHKADMAETAKRAVEGELRKWRQREQRKRAEASAAAQEVNSKGNNDVSGSFAQEKPGNYEPLGKVLNMKIPSPEKLEGSQTADMSSNKKKHQIPHVRGIFIKKKNQMDGISHSNTFHR